MGFSITSSVLGGTITIVYGLLLAWEGDVSARTVLFPILMILGFAEFVMGIWAAICLCVMKPCRGPAQVSVPLFQSKCFPVVAKSFSLVRSFALFPITRFGAIINVHLVNTKAARWNKINYHGYCKHFRNVRPQMFKRWIVLSNG